jgi:nucleoside-diphosphate-sugar epimerase
VRVLVTGAGGFTGGHLARALVAAGHSVRVLVRDHGPDQRVGRGDDGPPKRGDRNSGTEAEAPPREDSAAGHADRETVVGDLRDQSAVARAVEGVDVVYNIAALYRQAGLPTATYRAVNATAVGQLVEQAARAGVRRVVHCSTVGVHGDVEHPPANEEAPLRPGDVYQQTKVEGEEEAREAARRFSIEVTIARPSGIYGPGDRRLLKLFRQTVRRFPILGRGEIYYHLTYIDDLVDGFRLCGEHPGAANRTYILAGGEVTTLNELTATIAQVAGVAPQRLHLPVWPFWLAGAACEAACAPFGIEPPIYRRRVDFFTKSRAFDISRARTEIGYAPKIGVREGITRTLYWYREHGWL